MTQKARKRVVLGVQKQQALLDTIRELVRGAQSSNVRAICKWTKEPVDLEEAVDGVLEYCGFEARIGEHE